MGRYFQQGGIKLNERIFHGSSLAVAGVASRRGRERGCFVALPETEVRPFLRESSLVFDCRFDLDSIALIMAAVVDRAFSDSAPNLQN